MMILQVIEPVEQEIQYYQVLERFHPLIRAVNGKNFNSNDQAVDALCNICGQGAKFDPNKLGPRLPNLCAGVTEFCTFWLDG